MVIGIQYSSSILLIVLNDVCVQDMPNSFTTTYFGKSVDSVNCPAACVVPSLHCILRQNAMQMVTFLLIYLRDYALVVLFLQFWQEETMRLIEVVDQITGNAFVLDHKILSIFELIFMYSDYTCLNFLYIGNHTEFTEAITNKKQMQVYTYLACITFAYS